MVLISYGLGAWRVCVLDLEASSGFVDEANPKSNHIKSRANPSRITFNPKPKTPTD